MSRKKDDAGTKQSDSQDETNGEKMFSEEEFRVIVTWARQLGFRFETEDEIVKQYTEASQLYRLWPLLPECPKGWISGFDVLERWGRKPDTGKDAFSTWIYLRIDGGPLPNRFLFDYSKAETPGNIEYRLFLEIDAEETAREQNRQFSRNPWLFQPQLWWFKLKDVEFCENANSLIRDRMHRRDLSLFWLTPAEVQTRWNIDRQTLQRLVTDRVIDGNGLQAYYYRKPHHSLRHHGHATAVENISSAISSVRKTLIDEKPSSFLRMCLFRLKDVRRFELQHSEKLFDGTKDKDKGKKVFMLRTADYVKAWIRARPDLLNNCIRERLYVRCSIQTKNQLIKYYKGGPKCKSGNLMSALSSAAALQERLHGSGGTPGDQFSCPWKKTCADYDCDHMQTSRRLLLMPQ